MKKNLLSLVAAASILSVTNVALAVFTTTTKVKNVVQSAGAEGGDGSTLIELVDVTCALPDGTISPFIVRGDDSKHASLLSLALAAYLSGRSLQLGYDTSNCHVSSIRLQP